MKDLSASSDTARQGLGAFRVSGSLVALAILVAGIGLRAYRLDGESAFCDEVATLSVLDTPDLGSYMRLFRLSGDVVSPPVYFTLEYFWGKLVGTSVYGVRLLSILLGSVSLVLIFLIARDMFGIEAGNVSAALSAVSLFHIYYSQEIRPYALVMMLSALSAYSFIRHFNNGAKRWLALNVIANGLLLASHYMAAPMLLCEGLVILLFRWRRPRRWLMWGIANLCALVPLFLWMLTVDWGLANRVTGWIGPPGLLSIATCLLWFAGGLTALFPRAHFLLPASVDKAFGIILGILALIAVLWTTWRTLGRPSQQAGEQVTATRMKKTESVAFLLVWLIVPPLIFFVLSHVWRPCFVERYMVYSSLPLMILMGAAFCHMPTRWAKGVAAAVLVILYGYQLSLLGGPLRSDWRSVAAHVSAHGSGQDVVFVAPFWQRESFRFYSGLPDAQVHPLDELSDVPERADEVLLKKGGLWVAVWPLYYDIGEFEAGLRANGLSYIKTESRGMIPPIIYHITR